MIGWIRKYDSRRNSRIRQIVVTPCSDETARAIVLEEHGAKGVMLEEPDCLFLQPETLDEIAEIRCWLDACEHRIRIAKAEKAAKK